MNRKELPPIVNATLAGLYAFSAAGVAILSEGKINPDSNVPKASLLRSGNLESAGEMCGGDLPQLVSASPSSFICIEPPRILAGAPIKPQPEIVTPAPALEQLILTTYTVTVEKGDTFSQIIQRQFGTDEVYGEHFRDTVLQNADWLAKKSPETKKAIEELRQHPDWIPRTSFEAFVQFMRATGRINPGDIITFKEFLVPVPPQEENKETEAVGGITTRPTQVLSGFFGSGICTQPWGSQPPGDAVCEKKYPYTLCLQRGSGETPSYICVQPQIGGRINGDINNLLDQYFVIDRCPAIPGPCIGHLEKIENKSSRQN